MGASPGAIGASALVGPAQVAARLAEFVLLRRQHPLLSVRIAALMHPIGAAMPGMFGLPFVAFFAVHHGIGNGLLTLARGTLPLALFGPEEYGARTGLRSRARRTHAPTIEP
jgi:hypothetical protein